MKTLKKEFLKITEDINILDKENHITPYVSSLIEKLYFEIPKRRENTLKKIIKYTNQFPKVPVFKNYLMTFYANKGNDEKVNEINKWIIKEHPNYLYAKINYATTLLKENKIKEIRELLGNSLLLHELLPHRNEFLLDEILSYYGNTIQFLYHLEEEKEAENRLAILREIAGEDHPKLGIIEKLKFDYFFRKISLFNNEKEDDEAFIEALAEEKRKELQVTTPPNFTYQKQIDYLYLYAIDDIPSFNLNEFLTLDKKNLIDDLVKVLYDCFYRESFFAETYDEESNIDFGLHALNILLFLKADEAIAVLFDILRQDLEFIDFWFGDFLFQYTLEFLSLPSKTIQDRILNFMKEEYIISHNKNIVLESFMKITDFEDPNNRKQAVAKLDDFSDFLIKNHNDIKLTHNFFNAFFVTELTHYGIEELLPKIKKLFDLNSVDTNFCGSYDELKQDLGFLDAPIHLVTNYKTLNEVYENFKIIDNFDVNPFYEENEQLTFEEEIPKPLLAPKKIGRNDPCFCGSGKKYKKCCLN